MAGRLGFDFGWTWWFKRSLGDRDVSLVADVEFKGECAKMRRVTALKLISSNPNLPSSNAVSHSPSPLCSVATHPSLTLHQLCSGCLVTFLLSLPLTNHDFASYSALPGESCYLYTIIFKGPSRLPMEPKQDPPLP
jgi:hypothetical protein